MVMWNLDEQSPMTAKEKIRLLGKIQSFLDGEHQISDIIKGKFGNDVWSVIELQLSIFNESLLSNDEPENLSLLELRMKKLAEGPLMGILENIHQKLMVVGLNNAPISSKPQTQTGEIRAAEVVQPPQQNNPPVSEEEKQALIGNRFPSRGRGTFGLV